MKPISIKDLPNQKSSILSIGIFDGVHLGHQKLLQKINNLSQKNKLKSIVLTFSPHPAKFFKPDLNLNLIQTLPERINKIKSFGIDKVFLIKFDQNLANMEAGLFLENIILKLNPKFIISTKNHYFGKNKKGNWQFLEKNQQKFNYKLHLIEPLEINGQIINSSLIRKKIKKGDSFENYL